MTADPNRNPTFWNHNVVLVKYCDGAYPPVCRNK